MRVGVALLGAIVPLVIAFIQGTEIERYRETGPWNFARLGAVVIVGGGIALAVLGGGLIAVRRRSAVGAVMLGAGLGLLVGVVGGFVWSLGTSSGTA